MESDFGELSNSRTFEFAGWLNEMLSRSAFRATSATTSLVARRGFHATRARLSSPYHYPEGPRSNLPFNPLTKFFAVRFWGSMSMLEVQEEASNADSSLSRCIPRTLRHCRQASTD
ncbi:MAG: hypothetical protein M1834_006596 [Cirrosporium novae-zelandiae]|nr:MAG: hypothetical protein M1834_006596 [Cirrosporium novae-zelandiae]